MSDVTALITSMTDHERAYIETTIDSVLAQTYPCDVIVLLNQASNLFDGLEQKYLSVRFIRTDIRPLGAMRNFGMTFVNTRWVAFLDGDDIWWPKKIELQLACALAENAQLIGCDYRLIDEANLPFAYALSNVIALPSSWFTAAETMRDNKFREEPMIFEDVEWWNDYALPGGKIETKRLSKVLVDGSAGILCRREQFQVEENVS